MTGTVRFRTHAKVNLFLRVLGCRPDGFHEIETILHGVSLADDLSITPTATGAIEVEMKLGDGSPGAAPPPAENLVFRAAAALARLGIRHRGLRIEISKGVPIAAGMGGGSANAGGTFVVLNDMLDARLGRDELRRLAFEIGSDVPYCLEGGTALATGGGERLQALAAPARLWFVLGISRKPLSTAAVYAAWDAVGKPGASGSAAMVQALVAGDADAIAANLHNDLEAAAFALRPELTAKKEVLVEAGCEGALVSGSGPTVFGLCRSEPKARAVAERVAGLFDRIEIVQSAPRCLQRL